jgi:hypothetical protein
MTRQGSKTEPLSDATEITRRMPLIDRDERIQRWREKRDNAADLFWLSRYDGEAACLVEQAIDQDGYQGAYLAEKILLGTELSDGFITAFWRAVAATLRWNQRLPQGRSYRTERFLCGLLDYRHHLYKEELGVFFEVVLRVLKPRHYIGGRELNLEVLIDKKVFDIIPALKDHILKQPSGRRITVQQALATNHMPLTTLVLLQLLAMQSEESKIQNAQDSVA